MNTFSFSKFLNMTTKILKLENIFLDYAKAQVGILGDGATRLLLKLLPGLLLLLGKLLSKERIPLRLLSGARLLLLWLLQ